MSDENLWGTRNVAEYAYCPRLFYYMAVEGIFVPSADTEEGNHVHRRVDRPSKADKDDEDAGDGDRPKTVRSLALTSTTLGLTATLDLAEITGEVAVPVEYRKGRPKRQVMAPPPDDPGEAEEPPLSHPEPWPTDRVQIGLQAILLEEAHYTVTHSVLYYASEKLRITVRVDDALRSEALTTLEAAKQCATGPRPMPLINDSRCVRCSLQPICLPDEVNQQRLEEVKPRQIWPPRDEGTHLPARSPTSSTTASLRGPRTSQSSFSGRGWRVVSPSLMTVRDWMISSLSERCDWGSEAHSIKEPPATWGASASGSKRPHFPNAAGLP